ncbi:MAG: S9 family peptidase [Gemmatimonadetes bacterium]|nr:S9 family peptidase [Gemmatimonadota bacterium]
MRLFSDRVPRALSDRVPRDPTLHVARGRARRGAFRLAAGGVRLAGLLAVVAASSGVLPGPTSAQETRLLEIDDLFRLQRVGSPRVSPDGAWVAYTVSTTSLEDERGTTRVWMVPFEGGEPVPMTREEGSASDARWSPDGRWLSFLASRGEDAETQVWALDRRGGEARPLTDVEQGVSGYAWSPDGTRLALLIRDPEPDSAGEKENAPQNPWVIDRLQFKRDGAGYLTGDRRTHLWVLDVETRELRQLTAGRWDEGSPAWSPDGRRIAFVSNRTEDPDANSNSDIWIVDAGAAEPVTEPRRVTSNPGADRSPAWSPDGRRLAYVTTLEPDLIWYATSHLAVVEADGSGGRVVSRDLDRNVSSPRWSLDGASIWTELEDSGERHLARFDAADGRLSRPVSGPLSVGDYDIGPGGQVVALVDRLQRPAEVHALDEGGLRRITHVNDSLLGSLRLGEVRNVTFPSADGTEIEGFITFPPGYEEGRRYPTLLRIHGGPVSQFDHGFSFEPQLFAANGYLVVQANPRGSSGYGQDFSHAIWADWGNKDFQDVDAGVDFAVAQGWADPDRLGVGGWSYGGILTNYVITQTDRYEAAITGASEVFYPANYGHDHYQLQWEKELGLPWEDIEPWLRISPFMKVGEVTTPTLIMGGEDDWNVPIQNSEQLYQALRRRGVPTQLVVYPGQSHGLRVPSYQKDRLQRYLQWYDRWVKDAGQAAVSEGGRG